MYGGGFATIPAYLADIFGTKYVGGIHGRLLTAWSAAGVLGPLAITSLRQNSVNKAIDELMSKIDPAVFQVQFGAPVDQLKLLVGNPGQRRTCCVCYSQDRTHCFIPCGHGGYCEGCAQRGVRRGRCFQCRGDIERAFRVYI